MIAETFEKRHDHVLRDIENLRKDLPNFGEMFFETEAPDSYGRHLRQNRNSFQTIPEMISDKTVTFCRQKRKIKGCFSDKSGTIFGHFRNFLNRRTPSNSDISVTFTDF